jgi:hypothetical protein
MIRWRESIKRIKMKLRTKLYLANKALDKHVTNRVAQLLADGKDKEAERLQMAYNTQRYVFDCSQRMRRAASSPVRP